MTMARLIRDLEVGQSVCAPGCYMTFYGTASGAYRIAKITGRKFTVRTINHKFTFVLRLS